MQRIVNRARVEKVRPVMFAVDQVRDDGNLKQGSGNGDEMERLKTYLRHKAEKNCRWTGCSREMSS